MCLFDGISLAGAGTFLELFIEILNVGLVFLGDCNLSTFGCFNKPEINDFISFSLGSGLGVKSNFDVSNEWNFDVFSSIIDGVSLGSTGSFFKGSELFSVNLVFLVKTGLSAETLSKFVKSNLVGRNFSSSFFELGGMNGTDEWDLNVFSSICDSVSYAGTGTFLKVTVEFFSI